MASELCCSSAPTRIGSGKPTLGDSSRVFGILRILISCRLFSRVIDMKFVTSLCHSRGEFSGPLRAHICWPQDR